MTVGTIGDRYGRNFKTLRVSLLNACNMGCVYCVAGDELLKPASPAAEGQLSVSALLRLIERLHGQLQLDTVRLTGGEPLLYKDLAGVIEGIRSAGIRDIRLTTNGLQLEKLAASLKKAGLGSVNVSLDAVEEDAFLLMSKRHSVLRVIRGIDAALQAGLAVKINTVVMKGMNESQILPLLEFAFMRDVRIRFLELMAMGYLHDRAERHFFSREAILSVIATRWSFSPLPRENSATANYWQADKGGIFGIIANDSDPFCGDCNRLRLDSLGNIYGCLSSNHPIPLDLAESSSEWNDKLQQALSQKQELRFTGSDLSMLHIGG